MDTFDTVVRRLSRQSVERHFDAFADIDWEGEPLDPADPRWRIDDVDPLATTDWYRRQPDEARARIGLHRIATAMRTGWEFENVLQRGLLARAYWLPTGRPELRFLHHEVAEECQHTMMFQEFVGRCGLPVAGLSRSLKVAAELVVVPLARVFPALFFLFVLGGEDPIDHVQRQRLQAGIPHPTLERVIRIHLTEEARHLSFARHYLAHAVPRLGPVRRRLLAVAAPVLLGVTARQMLSPTSTYARSAGIPARVAREARRSPAARELVRRSVARTRRLCGDLGLLDPVAEAVWRAMGIGEPPAAATAARDATEREDGAGRRPPSPTTIPRAS